MLPIVTALFGQPEQPSHPVADLFAGADWLRLALVALLATVAAPIVEEIMFRGALYSHLRGTVFERVPLVSILAAAIASSFIFMSTSLWRITWRAISGWPKVWRSRA